MNIYVSGETNVWLPSILIGEEIRWYADAFLTGSTVSAPRTMIQYVATEYGIASLSGKTLRERAEAMASIAHPDFREELMKYAQENFK